MSRTTRSFCGLPLALVACTVAYERPAFEYCQETTTAALFGGSPDAGASFGVGINSRQRDVGRLRFTTSEGEDAGACTITRIAPQWALTAAHCQTGARSGAIPLVNFARDQRKSDPSCAGSVHGDIDVLEFEPHPSVDLMLLHLSEAGDGGVRISQRPVSVGSKVVMSGYGLREDASDGVREVLEARVVSADANWLRVSAGAEAGACVGDSGGPLLVSGKDGVPELVGVLSSGSVTCTGFDEYIRIDAFREWIARFTD